VTFRKFSPSSRPAVRISVLLGLRDGEDAGHWARIRAAQLFAGRQLAMFLLAANLVGAAIVALLLTGTIPEWQLGSWAAALAAVAVWVTASRLRTPDRPDGYATPADVRRTLYEGAALAVAWGAAPLLFAHHEAPTTMLALWMVLSVLMTAAAVAMGALALAAVTFIGGVALAAMVPLATGGAHAAAAATALFAMLLIVASIQRARSLVYLRSSELTLAERDETVSLLLREFEDSSADWLWETDSSRRIVKATARFAYACGLDPVTINGMSFLQVLAGPAWETGAFAGGLRELAEKLKNRENFRDLTLPVTIGGEQRWWEISASPRVDGNGAFLGFRGVGSDVTEQRATAEKISRMARFDALTGLPNRLFVNEALAQAMAEAERWHTRCAFMMIDLDRFKAVNDTLGHPVGDRLLGRVSERLAQLMTDNELIGRLGGDEFAVVVRDASDPERVERLARTIIETLSRPYEVDQHTLYIGASVGVATSPRDGRTAETLVRSADLALYRSKERGGGVFHAYEPQLHAEAEERRILEMALRKALENGELHLNYQPVVDADTGGLRGFEALLRWEHPVLGVIPPSKFVPIAEETRLIARIGEWVLRAACDEAAHWPDDLRVAVNVSPEQLQNPHFVTVVASALAQSGLPAQRLELEVTERAFVREGISTARVLEQILELGVRLSLDDFGTGYSSLGYLSRTRFSSIKIDRSFIQSAAQGAPEAIAIMRAVVALASSLGMATTAEGVETDAERSMVRTMGFTRIQGYYFGRPLPAGEARNLMRRGHDGARVA
jgi:diguanylate cyclase (GGDEF)-like protein/PAS domain S-box-containing protein